jgi:hypothetical protein
MAALFLGDRIPHCSISGPVTSVICSLSNPFSCSRSFKLIGFA